MLNSKVFFGSGTLSRAAARSIEQRKHKANDAKCKELGWVCVSMVMEVYGAWGAEAMESLSRLAYHPR